MRRRASGCSARLSQLHCLGKVKVRGHRVELEEVETVLKRCPGIAEAAVVSASSSGEAR